MGTVAEATCEEIAQYARVCQDFADGVKPETLVGNYVGHLSMHREVIVPALRHLRAADRVLDFACGPGRVTALLRDLGHRQVVGADVSHAALARAGQIVPEALFVWLFGDGTLPFPPGTFDAVVSTIALQHIQFFPVRHRYFEEFWRVLRPRGSLLIQLNGDSDGKHVRWFERGSPDCYMRPDAVCDEKEIGDHLDAVGFDVTETWRTPGDTERISWREHLVGKEGAWLWVLATRRDA